MKNTKEKILLAASQLFLRGGLSALSVRAIALEANVSTIGIYSYFKGKQGILDALYIEGFERVRVATNVTVDATKPKLAVLAAAHGYVKTAFEFQGHYRLIFGESDSGYQPSDEAKKVAEIAFMQIIKLISYLLPQEANLQQRQEVALQIWSIVHGYVSLKQHAIADVIDPERWQPMIVHAVGIHLDALEKLYQA